jgi:hypothetical protein
MGGVKKGAETVRMGSSGGDRMRGGVCQGCGHEGGAVWSLRGGGGLTVARGVRWEV